MAHMTINDTANDIKTRMAIWFASRSKIPPIHKLTLATMIRDWWRWKNIGDDLCKLPLPDLLTIGKKRLFIPQTMEQFGDSICYGQRMFFTVDEPNDVAIVIRMIAGYYYPIVTGRTWDDKRALEFGSNILNSCVIELFPVAFHMVNIMGEIADREHKLLQREPSKQERAAGIDRLNKFADLTSIMFLIDSFKCSESEVMAKPYNDCLVRFMLQKEQNAFADRLADVYQKERESKMK